MRSLIGNRVVRVPNVSGKACVEHVVRLRTIRGQNMPESRQQIKATMYLWINGSVTKSLYTKCIRVIDSLFSASLSVNTKFYTLYTPPTIITTTIN